MIHKLVSAKKAYLWGGTRLIKEFNKETTENKMAESWELSEHQDGMSKIEGIYINEYIKNHPECLGSNIEKIPFMIKLIDALKNLSIQVHPGNEYARVNENDNGKTETWYIVDCDNDAYLYQGLKRDSSREEVAKAIKDNTILDLLNKVKIHKGDVYHIPSGTIHAICENTLVYEIQQNSNVTYRLYDYDRVGDDGKKRTLHINQALDVINYHKITNQSQKAISISDDYTLSQMAKTDYYDAKILHLKKEYILQVTNKSFVHLLIVDGQVTINEEVYQKGDSLFIDAKNENYKLCGSATILIATLAQR